LRYAEKTGSKRVLEKLLLGEWDSILTDRAGRTVEYRDFEDKPRASTRTGVGGE
jgi:hypothetical protein